MNNRIDAIYARQSVDKKDSISIESQIEFCKYELKGGVLVKLFGNTLFGNHALYRNSIGVI